MTDQELIQLARDKARDLDESGHKFEGGIIRHLTMRISALQAENAEKDKEIERLRLQRQVRVDGDVMAVALELAETKAILSHVEAEREAAIVDLHSMHTLCMDIGGCCPECGRQIDELLDAACTFCKGPGVSCWKEDPDNENRCAAFEWRGAQGGGGDADN